jgi:hypothetical protein
MTPEYPMDYPKGWLAKELALYEQFGIHSSAKTPYVEIHLAVAALPRTDHNKFLAAWQRLCLDSDRDEAERGRWSLT